MFIYLYMANETGIWYRDDTGSEVGHTLIPELEESLIGTLPAKVIFVVPASPAPCCSVPAYTLSPREVFV